MRDIRVLVVDDSKVGRLTLVKKLEPLGAQVDTAESGQEALDYLAQARPDVIFMDHMMPDMDGFETTRRIKASPATRAIPVIVVSGNEGDEFVMEARAAGAVDAIVKPPAPGVLEAILAALPVQGAAPAAVEPITPEPVPVPQAVQPAPSPDRATVHAWVESQLAEAMAHLRDGLMADVGKTTEAAFAQQRNALEELSQRWRQHGDKLEADMAELRRGATEAVDAGKQMNSLEQRLQAMEAEMRKPLPDLDAMGQVFQAQLEDHRAQFEQRVGGLDSTLSTLSADVGRLSEEARTAQAELEQRIEVLAQQSAQAESTDATPGPDMDTLLAAMDERIAPRLTEMGEQLEAVRAELDGQGSQLEGVSLAQNTLQADLTALSESLGETRLEAGTPDREMLETVSQTSDANGEEVSLQIHAMQAELNELREQLSEPRLRALITDAAGDIPPPADQESAAEMPMSQPLAGESDSRLQAELEQLKAKVKALALMLAIGGAVLLATVGMLLFRG